MIDAWRYSQNGGQYMCLFSSSSTSPPFVFIPKSSAAACCILSFVASALTVYVPRELVACYEISMRKWQEKNVSSPVRRRFFPFKSLSGCAWLQLAFRPIELVLKTRCRRLRRENARLHSGSKNSFLVSNPTADFDSSISLLKLAIKVERV